MAGDAASFVDVGSGAGIPGMAFAIAAPATTGTLVEPRRKRANFLRHVRRQLDRSGIDIVEGRDDDVTDTYGLAMARAVFSPQEWIHRAEKLVAPGGRIACFINGDERTIRTELAAYEARIFRIHSWRCTRGPRGIALLAPKSPNA